MESVTVMDTERDPDRLPNITPKKSRKQGGQQKWWLDSVNRDAQQFSVRCKSRRY